jgi:hypothetical protein
LFVLAAAQKCQAPSVAEEFIFVSGGIRDDSVLILPSS